LKLVVFDVDGTLTDTNGVDDDCFLQAFEDALGITEISTDWENYPHTTDSAIALHVFQTKFARAPHAAEIDRHKTRFLELLQMRRAAAPAQFTEIAGAGEMLQRLRRENDWAVAIATGSRHDAVRLKMSAAEIEHADLPVASADNGLSREEILRFAIDLALEIYHQTGFEKIVSVGDGVWDVRAAESLGLAFLGIGDEETAAKLRRAGAGTVIENFTDYDLFLSSLTNAAVPQKQRPSGRPENFGGKT
jgi:phosphoglycolate phosphatase-like HAD superfamily hydrolase